MQEFEKFVAYQYQKLLEEKHILLEKNNGVLTITFNRPNRANGVTFGMFRFIAETLENINQDEDIVLVIFRGEGKHFCSGNDLTNFGPYKKITDSKTVEEFARCMADPFLSRVQNAFVNLKKVSIACGASVGFGFSMLPHIDYVFITKDSIFSFPLLQLAQGPEMISSVYFPKLLGKKLANEVIYQGRTITAKEMGQTELVHEMFDNQEELNKRVEGLINYFISLDKLALIRAKNLLYSPYRSQLIASGYAETDNIGELWGRKEVILTKIAQKMQKPTKNAKPAQPQASL